MLKHVVQTLLGIFTYLAIIFPIPFPLNSGGTSVWYSSYVPGDTVWYWSMAVGSFSYYIRKVVYIINIIVFGCK